MIDFGYTCFYVCFQPQRDQISPYKSLRNHLPIFRFIEKFVSSYTIGESSSVKKKIRKNYKTEYAVWLISFRKPENWYRSESSSSDRSGTYFRRKSEIDHSVGLFFAIFVGSCLRFARADCENERCHSTAAARRHCSNVVYTPKSNFVIRSVGRGTARRYTARTRWNCYRPEVHLTFGTVTTII